MRRDGYGRSSTFSCASRCDRLDSTRHAEISGTAGTTYADAETLDPTCYRGAGGRGYSYNVSDDDAAAASDDTTVTTLTSAASRGGPAAAALVALASSALVALAMMN